MISTITFIMICAVLAIIIAVYAWFFLYNKKDGVADILEEVGSEGEEHLVVAKSNVPYKYLKRRNGEPDSQKITGYDKFKPIEKTFSLPYLSRKTYKQYIFRDKNGLMHPMRATWDAKTKNLMLKPDYRETIDWVVNEFFEKDKVKEKEGKYDKLLQYGTPIVMAGLLIMGMILWWQHEEKTQDKIIAATNELDRKIEAANQNYNPVIMQKAMNIVARYELERGTQNWTETNIIVNT